MFIGRKKELAELERVYALDGVKLFVIGGASGAGKTTLIEEFCKDKNAIFFTADKDNGRANLLRFSHEILSHYNDHEHAPFAFWNSAFKYILDMEESKLEWDYSSPKNSRPIDIIVVLEELDELANRDTVFMDMLTKCIEREVEGSNILIIITSSDNKFLKKRFFAEDAPLHKWTAGVLMLEKFTLTDETVERIKAQAMQQSPEMSGSRMLKVSSEDVIIHEGEKNNDMYKIVSGKAVCYFGYGTDHELVIGTLKEGGTFGEYSLLTGKPGIYTVVAFTDMLLMRIGKDDFTKYFELNASNSIEVMKNLAGMLDILKVNIDMLRKESETE